MLTLSPPLFFFSLLALVASGVAVNFMLPHVVSVLSYLRRRRAVFNNKSYGHHKAMQNARVLEQTVFAPPLYTHSIPL